MHTLRRLFCQTALLAFVGLFCGAAASAGAAEPSSSPAPTPPKWRTELDAVRLLESAAAFSDLAADANPRDSVARQRIDAAYLQLAERHPNQPEIHRARADFYWRNDQPDDALPCWERAQTLAPTDAETAESLGAAYLRLGRTRDAATQFGRAVEAKPDQPQYHFALANVLYLFRHDLVDLLALPDAEAVLRRALEHFQRAAELAPTDRRLAQAYAETFYTLAKPDWASALAAWEAVLALSGQDTDFANGHLARVSLRLGRANDARKYLDQIKNPTFAGMKAKLLQQADKLPTTAAQPPSKLK